MKVIELLNKIANNDSDTPDYIEFFDRETSKANKMMVCEKNIIYYMDRDALFLNDEVEIIKSQEHKISEKLNDILRVDDLIPPVNENMYKIWEQTIKNQNKINEILDYLEEIE